VAEHISEHKVFYTLTGVGPATMAAITMSGLKPPNKPEIDVAGALNETPEQKAAREAANAARAAERGRNEDERKQQADAAQAEFDRQRAIAEQKVRSAMAAAGVPPPGLGPSTGKTPDIPLEGKTSQVGIKEMWSSIQSGIEDKTATRHEEAKQQRNQMIDVLKDIAQKNPGTPIGAAVFGK
jgi:hypothetical protein